MALVLRPDTNSPGDHQVVHGQWQIGQIDKRFVTGDRWFWALNGVPASVPRGIRLAGVTTTLDEAEAELNKSWQEWLVWAGFSDSTPATEPDSTPASEPSTA
jgi:hypothetical protein